MKSAVIGSQRITETLLTDFVFDDAVNCTLFRLGVEVF